ncbi:MAG: hypothetical protein PHQ04_07160 [Opitutaceae bacterium]|nr:hypothetical protein [Opitutaceae bacterium]
MRLAFVSTVLSYPWGGADKLWTAAAEAASTDAHAVFVAASPLTVAHTNVRHLATPGVVVHVRDSFTQFNGRRARWRQRVQQWLKSPRSLLAALDAFQPDFIFVNQGGAFDILIEDGLVEWLLAIHFPFALIC